ncbi:matrixin family metalloprotease [Pseudobacteriovorax antillogorgiicola]|uniref:Matrixin n=1 Tax=Pseudobacteriovorax antillogorgiicola TaxID=1513793 RepID=A0A1Y6CPK6_9BACT|nr:matrixin family metalloprotease [Pseudobacteriovorax antillogorgiicola]TCS42858.1 matrixin [Pseudobacteriovorax antillogorgiicola]SMF81983.1 Matrixin [Pseudobacteriovorax antillogorgiicola]
MRTLITVMPFILLACGRPPTRIELNEGAQRLPVDSSVDEEATVQEEEDELVPEDLLVENEEEKAEPEEAQFAEDPERLSLNVVFHLGDSQLWKDEASLKPVIVETQRILSLAKIEIIPQYTTDDAPTEMMDIYFAPEVPGRPNINGVSFGMADREIYVIDNVGLQKVDDKRPPQSDIPRYIPGAKPMMKLAITQDQAEQARTTAHEIGHQLGLPHRQDTTNLMASGTSGWTLNENEIQTMRTTAVQQFGAKNITNAMLLQED